MAFNFNALNTEPLFDYNTENFVSHKDKNGEDTVFWKTEDMYKEFGPEKEFQVVGVFCKSNRDDKGRLKDGRLTDYNAAVVIEDRFIQAPEFQHEGIRSILADESACSMIRAGRIFVRIEMYQPKRAGVGPCYKIVWITK